MGKQFKRTNSEKKREIIQQVVGKEITAAEAAREVGVSPPTISRWIDQWKAGSLVDRPTSKEKALEKENQKLKETIGSLYFHIEQLKKMADYKQRMKNANTSVITEENLNQFRKRVK